jgi:hypothetical protein
MFFPAFDASSFNRRFLRSFSCPALYSNPETHRRKNSKNQPTLSQKQAEGNWVEK